MQRSESLLVVTALLTLGLVAGCGRPATEAECEEIVERTARLKIQETYSLRAETVDEQVEGLKAKLSKQTMEGCVGKRVNERALRCVREAGTSEAVKECFH